MTGSLHLGIDVSRAEHVCHLLATDGTSVGRIRIPNTPAGGAQLCTWTVEHARRLGAADVRIGLESTGIYWWHLFRQLIRHSELHALPARVFLVNAHDVAHFKKALGVVDKSDPVDARAIAQFVRFRTDLHPTYTPDPRYDALGVLTRTRFQFAHLLGQEKTRTLTRVFQMFSAYGRGRPFSDVFGVTSQRVLAELTVAEIAELDLPALAQRIFRPGADAYFSAGRREEILHLLVQVATESYRCDADTESALRTATGSHLAIIQSLRKQIAVLEQAIADRMKAVPGKLQTIPGLGPVFEAGILAEIGPIDRFHNDDELARFAGLTWRRDQSGAFESDERPLTRRGNRYLRYYLCEAANSVRVHEPGLRSYYARKLQETQRHPHKRALVLSARHLLRTICVMLKRGQAFDSTRRSA